MYRAIVHERRAYLRWTFQKGTVTMYKVSKDSIRSLGLSKCDLIRHYFCSEHRYLEVFSWVFRSG